MKRFDPNGDIYDDPPIDTGPPDEGGVIVEPDVTDTTPPIVTIDNVPSEVTGVWLDVKGTASDNFAVSRVMFKIDNEAYQNASLTGNQWQLGVDIGRLARGDHSVSAIAYDSSNNKSAEDTKPFKVVDKTPPTLTVLSPGQDEEYLTQDGTLEVPFSGTSRDAQSEVAEIVLTSDNGVAPVRVDQNLDNWTAKIKLPRPQSYTVSVTAKDKDGNISPPVTRKVQVRKTSAPRDPSLLLTQFAYLDDLIDFAGKRVVVDGGNQLTAELLEQVFHQSFGSLTKASVRTTTLVSQPRIAIEVLRRYLKSINRPVPAREVSDYIKTAYVNILAALGTSYDEIRLARVASDTVRSTLAERLGISLSGSRPDQLDSLFLIVEELPPTARGLLREKLTEETLERLFGLARTTAEVNYDSVEVSALLAWKRDRLRRRWVGEDEAGLAVDSDDRIPVVDPDLLIAEDISKNPGNLAKLLYDSRGKDIETKLTLLRTQDTGKPPLERYEGLVTGILGPFTELDGLLTKVKKGEDIGGELKNRNLTIQSFLYLMKIRELLRSDAHLLNEEWEEVYSILLQVKKKRDLYASWIKEEQGANITISPDFFDVAERGLPDELALPRWRASVKARRRWREVLRSRWEQSNTLTQGVREAVQATEESTLPFLRDALVRATRDDQKDNIGNWVTQQLCIDVQMSGRQKTTRLNQAIESLQAVLFSLRIGDFQDPSNQHPAKGWKIDDLKTFDTEWQWLSQYQLWRAATFVFLYPDTMLQPSLLEKPVPINLRANGTNRWLDGWVYSTVPAHPSEKQVGSAPNTIIPPYTGTYWHLHQIRPTSGADVPAVPLVRLECLGDEKQQTLWLDGHFQDRTVTLADVTRFLPGVDRTGSCWAFERNGQTVRLRYRGVDANGVIQQRWLRFKQEGEVIEILLADSPNEPVTEWAVANMPSEYMSTKAFQLFLQFVRDNQPLTPSKAVDSFLYYRSLSRDYPLAADEMTIVAIIAQLDQRQFSAACAGIRQLCEQMGITSDMKPDPIPKYIRELFFFVPIHLALQLHVAGHYLAALDWFKRVYAFELPAKERKIYYGLELERNHDPTTKREEDWLLGDLNPHKYAMTRRHAYTRFTLMSLVRCLLDFGDAEFSIDTSEAITRARELYLAAEDIFRQSEWKERPDLGIPYPESPMRAGLERHAQAQLFKIRDGRNAAGMMREIESPITLAGAPIQAIVTRRPSPRMKPTPYYFSTLMKRAKELVGLAQQIEASYLGAMEKREAATYDLIKAGHDLRLAEATIQLQDLRVTEADKGIELTYAQTERAITERDGYQGMINAGLNSYEYAMLASYNDIAFYRNMINETDLQIGIIQQFFSLASAGNPISAITGVASAAMTSVLLQEKSGYTSTLNNAEATLQTHSLMANYERQKQQWQFHKEVAQKDIQVAKQQTEVAKAQRQVVEQERTIAQLQQQHAVAIVEFLSNKFLNAEVYEWMVGVLARVYRSFLQQATVTALMAQYQLAFERQEPSPVFIQTDYWAPPTEDEASRGKAPDRRGLMGSARLLQDLYRLDQFAFETAKRKLQLSEAFSLSRLVPFEFQRFRETGVLSFRTPMEMFDRAFPGQYLRLIRRARVSIIALVPPTQGVRATLTASGVSRVVVGGETFESMVIRRDPEMIAFTTPSNATGILELEPQSDMHLPFEGMGVDTNWQLHMPKAANSFDYRSIADVLLTLEYTALHSLDYRDQVIRSLDAHVKADRGYSMRQDFPDLWYHLHNRNGQPPDEPLKITFRIDRREFPPHVESLRIDNLVLYFAMENGTPAKFQVELTYAEDGIANPISGTAQSYEGKISTRAGSASSWAPLIGRRPFGTWTVNFLNKEEVIKALREDKVEDILFVLSYAGESPAWPA